MKKQLSLLLFTLFASVSLSLLAQKTNSTSLDFTKLIPEHPEKRIFSMKDYNIWCNGVVKGEDGKYHMFFSRWPKSRGHEAWCTHSEVAHAVADNLFGPYIFSDVSLPARGTKYWDGEMTHNPHVIKYKGKYYLYYTANTGSGYWATTGDSIMPKMKDAEWWVNRNNQRVGVAVAASPYGPWKRFDKPLLDTVPGRKTMGVPTVFIRPDGQFSLAYKSVMGNAKTTKTVVKHFIALSKSPLGPFKDYDKPFITSPKTDFPIDDHVEWFQDGKFYCIAKDHGDKITEHGIALLLFESLNGLDWKLSDNSLVHKFNITFSNGESFDFDRFEMPKVYLEKGKVVALFLAAKQRGKENSFSVVLPVEYKSTTAQSSSPIKTDKNKTIQPGEIWRDTDGNVIHAHGGGMLFHKGIYYWFGEYKTGKTWLVPGQNWECYRTNAGGVSCYSSKDLLNWKFEGIALAPNKTDSTHDLHFSKVLERPKVIYNAKTKKFVLWLHVDSPEYGYARAGVAVSNSPAGPYTYLGSMRPNNQMSRDMTLFQDTDGKAYHIFSSENNATTHISLLTDDYLKPTGISKRIFIKKFREAPSMFKRNNKFYLITSGCTGWVPNAAMIASADSVMGNWKEMYNPCIGPNSHRTFEGQSCYVTPLYGKKDAFIFMADRWNKTNLPDSRYIWLPITFRNDSVLIEWKNAWNLNSK